MKKIAYFLTNLAGLILIIGGLILIIGGGIVGPTFILAETDKEKIFQIVNTYYPEVALLILAIIVLGIMFNLIPIVISAIKNKPGREK